MKKFEYKILTPLFQEEKKLNQLGYEGWELIAVDHCSMYMKREYND